MILVFQPRTQPSAIILETNMTGTNRAWSTGTVNTILGCLLGLHLATHVVLVRASSDLAERSTLIRPPANNSTNLTR